MTGWVCSIDLGTTFTAAAMRNGSGVPAAVPLATQGSRVQLPSLVFVDSDGHCEVGHAAQHLGIASPRLVRCPKMRLGDGYDPRPEGTFTLIDGTTDIEEPAPRVCAALIAAAYRAACDAMGGNPTQVRHRIRSDGRRPGGAGCSMRPALPGSKPARSCCWTRRPLPSGTPYSARGTQIPVESKVAAFDLGGGTLDIALLLRTETGFKVVASAGLDQVGGEDFDARLFEWVVERIAATDSALAALLTDRPQAAAPTERSLWQDRQLRLVDDVRKAKERLSSVTEADIAVSRNEPDLAAVIEVTVSRAVLERLISEPVGEALRCLADCARQAAWNSATCTRSI